MGISGNMQSLSQLCACYGVPRVTRGFTTLFIGETFAVYVKRINKMITNYADFLNKSIFLDSGLCANLRGDDMFEKM